jgi:CRISPR-associated protein Cas1
LTTQTINLLLQEGIDVSFLTLNGKLRGRLVASESKNVILRLAQYERYLDDEFQLTQARAIVKGKISNARAMILRHLRNHPELNFSKEIELIEQTLRKLDRNQTVNSLVGAEGIATAAYFRCFGQMFRKELIFTERSRRPPKDPVNAILSLGYTMITNEILGLVIAHGLDPYIGFLHGIVYGRPSLALDLVEEFRHPIIDRLTLNLFNNELLTQDDFRPVAENGIYLTEEGIKKFFQLYEQRLKAPFKKNKPDNFRTVMKRQVLKMAQSIQNLQPYQPFKRLE